jgi:hypothetical protein
MNDRPAGRGDPDHDAAHRPAGVPVTTRLGGSGRGAGIVATLIAIFVGLALLKPWPGAGSPRPTPQASVAPRAIATADPLAALRRHCEEPTGWRIYSRERWSTMTIRSWRSFEPAPGADGPLDPTIPVIPLGAQIVGLGYCSPWTGGERPPAEAQVGAWRLVPRGRAADEWLAATIPLQPLDPSWPSVLGALYGPPLGWIDPIVARDPAWLAGRYVFAIRGPGYERWWGVNVEPPFSAPVARPVARPAPSRGATP